MDRPESPVSEVPPVLQQGGWINIGYDSALKFDKGKLFHRLNGKVIQRNTKWLMVERPLLVWVLNRESGIDSACKPA
tara:strand:+ start:886 stop:1116 length:231 start_codon:yes stop_codon:yes gene_type:complete